MKAFWLVAVLCALAAACGGDGSEEQQPTAVPETFDIEGTLTLADVSRWQPVGDPTDQYCQGKDAYADIGEGTQVVAKDSGGTVIGTWPLGLGIQAEEDCLFAFAFNSVPRSESYAVGIENRGAVTYTFDTMQSKDWMIALIVND